MLFREFNEQGVTASRFELLNLDTRGCAADAHSASDKDACIDGLNARQVDELLPAGRL